MSGFRDGVLTDPDVVTLGADAPSYRFDGQGGGLILDDGWNAANRSEEPFAWITDKHATVFFGSRGDEDVAFRALARSFWFEGASGQTLTLTLNGNNVGETSLTGQWEELSMDLRARYLVSGLNRIDLDFSFASRPKDHGMGDDKRKLSAAFRWLAIDRKPNLDRDLGERRARINRANGSLELSGGAEVQLPMAPGITVRWAGLEPDVEIAMEKTGGGWETIRPSTDTGAVTVTNSENGVRFLRIRRDDSPTDEVAHLVWSSPEKESPAGALEVSIGHPKSASPPHVFIYVVDTVRKDALQIYGSDRPTSPELNAFAQDSVVFDKAVVASTWTLPSVVSMLTGVYPARHHVMRGDIKVTENGGYPILPKVLSEAGYTTLGISQSFVAGPRFGIDIGFEKFFLHNHLNGRILRTGDMRRVLTDWLSYSYDWSRPIFAYFHSVGPHAPYTPTEEFMGFADENPGSMTLDQYRPARFVTNGYGSDETELAHLRALYDGEIAYADAEFGRFIDQLKLFGVYDDSLIVFISDHGEEFYDHGAFDHGRTVYNEVAEVPLIVKFPRGEGMPRGQRSEERVSSLDLFPTVLEMAEIAAPAGGWSRNLLATAREDIPETEEQAPRAVFTQVNPVKSDEFESVDYLAAWVGDIKCIHSRDGLDSFGNEIPRWRYFDVEIDPGETQPLAENDERTETCREILEAWMAAGSEETGGVGAQAADEETLEMLRTIGYIE